MAGPFDKIYKDCEHRMHKAVEVLQRELNSIRTGRASPSLLDRVQVEAYGVPSPLTAVASISVPEPRMIVIQPWDRRMIPAIEKAIQKSDLGLNPVSDGSVVRLAIPPLNEERRRELVKQVHKRAEEARVAVRNCRRDAVDELKKAEKASTLSEDEVKRGQDRLQKLTDSVIGQIDKIAQAKEREVMEF